MLSPRWFPSFIKPVMMGVCQDSSFWTQKAAATRHVSSRKTFRGGMFCPPRQPAVTAPPAGCLHLRQAGPKPAEILEMLVPITERVTGARR